jgi:uncharacterized membrane protein YdjX (TVP38/TMEM64 family)
LVETILQSLRDLGIVPFFAGLAVLPLVGIPTTPFYVLAGATFGVAPSVLGAGIAHGVGLTAAHRLGQGLLRPLLVRLLARRRFELPEVGDRDELDVALLIRAVPGPPHFLKNYLLAMAGVRLRIFLLVSWPLTMSYAVGWIWIGGSLVDASLGRVALGFLWLGVVALALARIRRRKRRGQRQMESSSARGDASP